MRPVAAVPVAALALAFLAGAGTMAALMPGSACSMTAGCALAEASAAISPKAIDGYEPVDFKDVPGWASDDHAAALATFAVSCRGIAGDPSRFGGGAFGDAEGWAAACRAAFKTKPADARVFFETYFEADHVAGGGAAGSKITGYYEPELKGSRTQSAAYPEPVYAAPGDLVTADPIGFQAILHGERLAGKVVGDTLTPYETRGQIEAGALGDRAKPLLYLTAPVESFFLQIQGSGRVKLDTGGLVRLGYKAQNGHPYVSIGGLLVARKEIRREDLSMQTIRAWLTANPERAGAMMDENPSYVFFTQTALDDPSQGPMGAENVALTPGRSMAVDDRVYPYGVPIFITGEIAAAGGRGREPIARLMVAQDTGGAIRGAVRGDIFFGWGAEAEARAGATGGPAEFYVLRAKIVPDAAK